VIDPGHRELLVKLGDRLGLPLPDLAPVQVEAGATSTGAA
jgi:hypothetical protein